MRLSRFITVILTAAICLCFTACGEESSSEGVLEALFGKYTGEPLSSLTDEQKADQQVMLMFKCEPNANSGKGQAETEYRLYYSGRVKDEKSGAEKSITGAELEKLKKYADDILKHTVDTKYEGGDASTDTTVAAYDMNGTPRQITAVGECRIDGFDEMYKIVTDKFKV